MKYIIIVIVAILLIRFRDIPEWIWLNNPVRKWIRNRKYKNQITFEDQILFKSDKKGDRKKYVKKVLKHVPDQAELYYLRTTLSVECHEDSAWLRRPSIEVYDDDEKGYHDPSAIHYTWEEYNRLKPPTGFLGPMMNLNKARANGAL